MTRSPPGRSTRANSASTGWSRGTWTRASAQMMTSTEPSGSGSWSSAATWNSPSGTRRRAWASMSGELSIPMTWCPRLARNSAKRPGPAGGVQRHARFPVAEVLGHDRLVGREQPAARLRVVAGGLLLVGGDGADPLGEHRAVGQLLVIQEPPDLGGPGIGELPVLISGPGAQHRAAFQAE